MFRPATLGVTHTDWRSTNPWQAGVRMKGGPSVDHCRECNQRKDDAYSTSGETILPYATYTHNLTVKLSFKKRGCQRENHRDSTNLTGQDQSFLRVPLLFTGPTHLGSSHREPGYPIVHSQVFGWGATESKWWRGRVLIHKIQEINCGGGPLGANPRFREDWVRSLGPVGHVALEGNRMATGTHSSVRNCSQQVWSG